MGARSFCVQSVIALDLLLMIGSDACGLQNSIDLRRPMSESGFAMRLRGGGELRSRKDMLKRERVIGEPEDQEANSDLGYQEFKVKFCCLHA